MSIPWDALTGSEPVVFVDGTPKKLRYGRFEDGLKTRYDPAFKIRDPDDPTKATFRATIMLRVVEEDGVKVQKTDYVSHARRIPYIRAYVEDGTFLSRLMTWTRQGSGFKSDWKLDPGVI